MHVPDFDMSKSAEFLLQTKALKIPFCWLTINIQRPRLAEGPREVYKLSGTIPSNKTTITYLFILLSML